MVEFNDHRFAILGSHEVIAQAVLECNVGDKFSMSQNVRRGEGDNQQYLGVSA